MNIWQALDYAAEHDLLLTFYRHKRTVALQDRDGHVRVEERHHGGKGPISPGAAVIRAVQKIKTQLG